MLEDFLSEELRDMPQVTFVNEKITVDVPQGANLRKEAMKAGVQVYDGIHKVLHCPGLGQCGSCQVEISKGQENLSRPGFMERLRMKVGIAFFKKLEKGDALRLACQTSVLGDCEVKTHPGLNLHGEKFWG